MTRRRCRLVAASCILQLASAFGFAPQPPALCLSRSRFSSRAPSNVPVAPKLALSLRQRPPAITCSQGTSDDGDDGNAHLRKNPVLYSETTIAPAKTTGSVFKSNGTSQAVRRASSIVKPEVLAPAGGWPQLRAAVQNGADACYFGLSDFNARARASNFDPEEDLPRVMDYLHEHGVKGYVTINVLIFDTELEGLERMVRQIARCGVDAVIVQDVGAVQLIKAIAPNLRVHGSTQMSITSTEGARFAQHQGVSRVVLGRELSLREIAAVRQGFGNEIEVFVHGALCVSYSGQCFSSEAWGGRSANRGQCAQACRLPYGLVLNGEEQPLGDVKYLLSPQDLMAVELVPDLMAAGVTCFKIEGRLKGPEYVALTTQVYRQAVDRAWSRMQESEPARQGNETAVLQAGPGRLQAEPFLTKEVSLELAQVFARGQDGEHGGLTPGFLQGSQHQRLVRGRSPRHRGILIGHVQRVLPGDGGVVVRLCGPIKRGDGVVFDRGAPEEKEEGGHVYEVLDSRGRSVAATKEEEREQGEVTLTFGRRAVDARRIARGDLVWKNRDAALDKKLAALVAGKPTREQAQGTLSKAGVMVTATGAIGAPLTLTLTDPQGRSVAVRTAQALQPAERKAVDGAAVAKAVGQLGGTGLQLAGIDVSGVAAGAFIPLGEIKQARRRAVEEMLAARVDQAVWRVGLGVREEPALPHVREALRDAHAPAVTGGGAADAAAGGRQGARDALGASAVGVGGQVAEEGGARVTVLCRSRAQAEAALEVAWLEEIILDFLEVQGLNEAVSLVRSAGKRVVVATPRVLKPEEDRMWRFYVKLGADALLVRSAGMLQQLQDLGGPGAEVLGVGVIPAVHGDFSLNVANELSARAMLRDGQLSRLTPTHDLNAQQLQDLAVALGGQGSLLAGALEAIVHQHLPIFHTEHCVFCRFLSEGDNYTNCGHPCETNTVHLRDERGSDHLVLADMGCRNTVFNAQAQSGAFFVSALLGAGYRSFRIELVDEHAGQVSALLNGYRDVILGHRTPGDLWAYLRSVPDANGAPQGVDAGSLKHTRAEANSRPEDRASLKKTAAQSGKWASMDMAPIKVEK